MEPYYYPMSTTKRHNRLASTLISNVIGFLKRKEMEAFVEQCPLVYFGRRSIPSEFRLVDLKEIDDIELFKESGIYELEYVQPDFMFFKNNPFIENERGTRTAGRPDLVVEIWSERNSSNDRLFLKNLYATSPVTEHWYLEQDSNHVECYFGRENLPAQNLENILKTQNGIEFDLRYLAI